MDQEQSKKMTAEQRVYKYVKDKIMSLEFRPGQHINDRRIAVDLKISRTPVRDAFRRLEYERLIVSHSRYGWQVCSLSLDDIREIFDVKIALQGMIVHQAAECSHSEMKNDLMDAMEKMLYFESINDQDQWQDAHFRLHEVWQKMSSFPEGRVADILSNLNDQWRRIRLGLYAINGYRARETRDHVEISKAILAGNGEEAEKLMRSHLYRVRDELIKVLENLVFPFVTQGI